MNSFDDNSPSSINLKGRKILVISPRFFGYENRIVEHLRQHGAIVWFLDERPSNTFWIKVLVRLNSIFIKHHINQYYKNALDQIKNIIFDDILINSPECCSSQVVKRIKQQYPNSRFILYMWDSFRNKHIDKLNDTLGFIQLFDRCLSFDDEDSRQYRMIFCPLFFTNRVDIYTSDPNEFAFSFVGTIHSDRYRIIKRVRKYAQTNHLNHFVYLFLPSKAHYWWYRLTKPEFRGTHTTDFEYKPLPYEKVMNIFSASQAILDIEHPEQRGLTIRSLEVIGAGKKLITTNINIRSYAFYDISRIALIDRKNPRLEFGFFESSIGPPNHSHISSYEIHEWTKRVFNCQ